MAEPTQQPAIALPPASAPAGAAAGRPSWRERAFRWLRDEETIDAVVPALLVQAALRLFAPVAYAVQRGVPLASVDPAGVWNNWDAPHYLTIAAGGYSATTNPEYIVFFPLLPALIRVGSILLDPLVVGLIIATASSVLASVGLYRLARLDASRGVARVAVLLLLVFPSAFTFAAPYTEPLFLAAVAWSFLRARRGDWRGAGVLGLVASLARLQGVFLLPALGVEYLLSRRRIDRAALWLALPLLGPITYLAINQAVFDDPLHFLAMQRQFWYHETAPPWIVLDRLVRAVAYLPRNDLWATVYLAPLVAFALLGVAGAWSIVSRRSRPSYAIYVLVTLGSLATLTWPISVPRYVLGVFPVFLMLGGLARWPVVAVAVGVVSAALLLWFTALFSIGAWAF